MIFGVFDGLHDGHRFLIEQAQKYGDQLIIVVTPDDTVKFMKDKIPHYPLMERIMMLEKEYPKAEVITGDSKKGMWTPIKKYQPQTIVLGYDQNALCSALKGIIDGYSFEIIQIKKHHKGDTLHSSMINKKA